MNARAGPQSRGDESAAALSVIGALGAALIGTPIGAPRIGGARWRRTPFTLLLICLIVLSAAGALFAQEAGEGKAAKAPPPKPKLKAKAWLAQGDEYDLMVPRGKRVPIVLHLDNPEAAWKGEARVEAELYSSGSYQMSSMRGQDYGGAGSLTSVTRREIEIGADEQRYIVLYANLPENDEVALQELNVVIVREGQTLPVVPVGTRGSGFDGIQFGSPMTSLLILAEERRLFVEDEKVEHEIDLQMLDQLRVAQRTGVDLALERALSSFSMLQPIPATLPANASAFSGVGGVFVYAGGVDATRFGAPLQAALVDHVHSGGIVFLAPATRPELYETQPLVALSPVQNVRPTADLPIPDRLISSRIGAAKSSELVRIPGLLADLAPGAEAVETVDDAGARIVLVARMRYGLGAVYWFAYDPTPKSLKDPALKKILDWMIESRDSNAEKWKYEIASQDEGEYLLVPAPPRSRIVAFLGLYILVLVPLTFVVFSLMHRREYAWLAMPIIALVFTFYYYNSGISGRLTHLTSQTRALLVIAPTPAAQATPEGRSRVRVEGMVDLYTPRVQYGLAVSCAHPEISFCYTGKDLAGGSELSADLKMHDDSSGLTFEGFAMQPYSIRSLTVDGMIDMQGQLGVRVAGDETSGFEILIDNHLKDIDLISDAPGKSIQLQVFHGAQLSGAIPLKLDVGRERLASGESMKVVLDSGLLAGAPGGRSGSAISVFLVARHEGRIVDPLVNGRTISSQPGSYVILVRLI